MELERREFRRGRRAEWGVASEASEARASS